LRKSEAILEAWCVTATLAAGDVYVGRAANAIDTGVAQMWAQLPKEYELVAGGARAFFEEEPDPGVVELRYAGALLLASAPLLNAASNPIGWYASATDHLVPSPVAVEAYAIGINRDVLRQHKLLVVFDSEQGAVADHPTAERTLERWISP